MARCLLTACRVISRRALSSLKVWPLCARSRSRSFLRLASASALNTSSMATICNHLVACQGQNPFKPGAALLLRRLDDGVVAVGVEADEIPRLAHVRRQRRRDVDSAAARMRHDDAARQEMQAVLHAARQLPVLLREIFRIAYYGMADMRHVRTQLMRAAGHRLEREPGELTRGGVDHGVIGHRVTR